VKSVLRLAESGASHSAEVASLLRRTRKIAFLGTPHFGSDQASWVNRLGALLRPRETTAGLSRNDAHLRDLNTWFRSYAATHGVEAIVLRETLRAPFLGIPGLGGIVVKADSADPGLAPATQVIPIVADHHGIVAPKNREADAYWHLMKFLSTPADGQHRDMLVADSLGNLAKVVAVNSENLASQLLDQNREVLAAVQSVRGDGAVLNHSAAPRESSIVAAELDRRLWLMRKSRYFVGYEVEKAAKNLVADIEEGGDLEASGAPSKMVALAWCARVLGDKDLDAAVAALSKAMAFGNCDEITIAVAFADAFGSDPKVGLSRLAALRTPMANAASFLIGARNKEPAEALQWMADAGLSLKDMDSDGRYAVLQRMLAAGELETALKEAEILTDSDFEQTPILNHTMAVLHLASAVHPDLRSVVIDHLPTSLNDFPLNDTPEAKEHRHLARSFYGRSNSSFADLGQERLANVSGDYELWLALREDESHPTALKALEASMADPSQRLRRLPMALQFRLKLEQSAVELELDREATRTGGKSADLAVARFAMARSQSSPAAVAAYLDRYRDQLTEYFNPAWIKAVEIEALARSGELADARSALVELQKADVPESMIESLSRLIAEEAGSDPVESIERQYLATGSFQDLLNVFNTVRERSNWPKLAVYAKVLFEQTQSLAHGIAYAEALYRTDQYPELYALGEDYPALAASLPYKHIEAWTRFRSGDVVRAKRLMEESRVGSDGESTATLESNIAIASGDWNALHVLVETQWARKDDLSPLDLLRTGQMAQHIDSARDQDLIREAARRADGDAGILVACYSAAVTAGWEDSQEIHEWFSTAVANSGDDGPIRRFDFRELIDMAPDWSIRENDAWDQLLRGDLPMYAGAFLVHRSPLEMFTMTALANLEQSDPRKRGVVFAFSGTRPLVDISAKCTAFDVSALLTLSVCGQLENAFELFDGIRLSHRTMAWLLEQRHAVRFHQPSRIADADELRRLIDAGGLRLFEPTDPANVRLETEFGAALAAMLVSASKVDETSENGQRLVVRSFPVHRPDSLMEELSDASGLEHVLIDCKCIVNVLKLQGQLTEAEEMRARKHLAIHEDQSWPHPMPTILPGAVLYLDGLSVSYLQFLGLLGKLRAAGFTVFVSEQEVAMSDALLKRRIFGESVHQLIEEIRSSVLKGLLAGRILLAPSGDEVDYQPNDPRNHPTIGLFAVPDADAFVIDDRFFNQHGTISVPAGGKPVHTSLDLLEALRGAGRISDASFSEALTRLRNAGFLMIPILPSELESAIVSAPVEGGILRETAELKSVRESLQKVRMTDALQLPKEGAWIDWNLRVVVEALRRQWSPEISDELSRARSDWLLPLIDARGWAHRTPADGPTTEERRAMQILLLSRIGGAQEAAQDRYYAWFEETVLQPVRGSEPSVYQRVLGAARSIVEAMAEREVAGLPDEEAEE
jgi:hypothetical protein